MVKRQLSLPGLSLDVQAGGEANLATSYCALGQIGLAQEALERGKAVKGCDPLARAVVLSTCGHCAELRADIRLAALCGGPSASYTKVEDATALALLNEAKAYYKEANAIAEDLVTRRGFLRVQAKAHPEVEWQPLPEPGSLGDGALGGAARVLVPGTDPGYEELPPGPKPKPKELPGQILH